MARDETPPFARGETFYNGGPIDLTNLGGQNYEGKEYVFEVNSPDGYTQNDPTGRLIRVRVVRNTSSINLLPKRLARHEVVKPLFAHVDGYVFQTTDILAGVIDEFLPAAGVPPQDLFYLVTDGPTIVQTVTASLTNLAIGDRLEAATGTSATNADAGRVNKYAASPTVTDASEVVGRSEAVVTTTSTDLPAVVSITRR